ncbi:MAG: hypothetical protein V3U92_10395 [Cellulophaga sp.]
MKKYIEISLGSYTMSHGYDINNKEIKEEVSIAEFSRKVIAMDRIKSLSDTYILTDYVDGRWIYWEYKESYEAMRDMLLNEK